MNWKRGWVAVAVTFLAIAPAAAADHPPVVIFNPKSFYDSGDVVHVEGTLAGDGIGYKNNRSAITCSGTGESV